MAKTKKKPDVKTRRVNKKDWEFVQTWVSQELDKRKKSQYRKRAEEIWREVDRQVSMEPMKATFLSGKQENTWHSAVELGELAKTSEIYSADFKRITFPRKWFEAHSEIEEEGQDAQDFTDGSLRALMAQQHKDFGFKKRVGLTGKEAFHHGCYGVEVLWSNALRFPKGTGVASASAPIWVPHSMWNTFPDPSPSVSHGGLFYDGSMIFRSYMPRQNVKAMAKGGTKDGWMNIGKIPKRTNKNKDENTEDVELLTYYGDIDIPRKDGNIFLPNSKVITANGVIIYWKETDTEFPPVIYGSYEKLDVRDPYGTSPIMKFSPMQKLASIMANKSVDTIATNAEPPIVYDSGDIQLIENGGPDRYPGASNPARSLNNVKELPVGDPQAPLAGLQMTLQQLQAGTGIDSPRVGGGSDVEKTAFEVRKTKQGGEIRIVEFIEKFESEALTPFLYMQHELNKQNLKSYPFYNSEMDAPDFMRADKSDLPKNVHFEIVGSKGILGEEERQENTNNVLAYLYSNERLSPLLDDVFIVKNSIESAGNKNPERFLKAKSKEDETQARIQQIQDEFQAQAEEMQEQLNELGLKVERHDIEKQELKLIIRDKDGKIAVLEEQIQLEDKINQDLKILNENKLVLDEISDKLKEIEKDKEG